MPSEAKRWLTASLLLILTSSAPADDAIWGIEFPWYRETQTLRPDWPSAIPVGSEVGYGSAIAQDGNWLLVGAPFRQDNGGLKTGAVFLYRREGLGWVQTQRIQFATGTSGECGTAVALRGNWAVVGCPMHDGGRGRVLLYRLDPAAAQLVQPETYLGSTVGEACGADVALAGTGLPTTTYMAFGCPRSNAGGPSGRVQVFRYSLSSVPPVASWTDWGEINAQSGHSPVLQGLDFGARLAMELEQGSSPRLRLLIGMPQARNGSLVNAGLAFIYERPTSAGSWSLVTRLQPNTGAQAFAQFGRAVALSNQLAVVGAPQAIAAPGAEGTGLVFPFIRVLQSSQFVWLAGTAVGGHARLTAASGGEGFGLSVALNGDELWVAQPLLIQNRTQPYVQRYQRLQGAGFVRRQAFFLDHTLELPVRGSELGLGLVVDPGTGRALLGAPLARTAADEAANLPWGRVLSLQANERLFRDRFAPISGRPGQRFKDCRDCPIMIGIPSGSFQMGALAGDLDQESRELPRRQVQVGAFALSQTEVTFAQWDACVADGGCSHSPSDAGLGRGDQPVVNVSWNDAQQYVAWLSARTGSVYRLPSEAEWEYAARVGAAGRFPRGACLSTLEANFDGNSAANGCPSSPIARGQPIAVGSFPPNALGLHDMLGNVLEWTADCWNESYAGAPTTGQAWSNGDCSAAPIRGGEYGSDAARVRLSARDWDARTLRTLVIGFRVARTVSP
ncbi:MAG: SUMF1/EgtB/PvdO family nonheme iron enzyme [Wenzhouxiangella sp.]